MKPIRIMLVDDHKLVRSGIRLLLKTIGHIQVVAEADNGLEALRLAKIHRPDVMLVDIAIPKVNGLEVARQVVANSPSIRVVMLSMYINEEYVLEALRIGVNGYLSKDAHPADLGAAIKAASRGESYLPTDISERVEEYIERMSGSDSGQNR